MRVVVEEEEVAEGMEVVVVVGETGEMRELVTEEKIVLMTEEKIVVMGVMTGEERSATIEMAGEMNVVIEVIG